MLAPRLEGIVTAVYVKPEDALADGKPVLSVSGIGRLGFAAETPSYRRTAQTGREFTLLCLTSGSAAAHDAGAPQGRGIGRRASAATTRAGRRRLPWASTTFPICLLTYAEHGERTSRLSRGGRASAKTPRNADFGTP